MSKTTVTKLLIAVTICTTSCNSYKADIFRKNVSAYEISTRDFERQYISVLVHVGKDDPYTGPTIEKRGGYIVLKGERLYYLLYENQFNSINFSNFLFSKLVRKDSLLINSEQFEKLKPYLISENDAEKYLAIKTSNLFKKYTFSSDHLFSPSRTEEVPGYESRCILFNFLNNGINVFLQHESLLLECKPIKL